MPADLAIEALGLEKRFPKARSWREILALRPASPVEALRGLDLEVPRGAIHGLLGANGAGKTTLLKVLSTLVVPDNGKARIAGFDVATEAARVREQLGFVVAEERSFYWRLSGRDNLLFFASLQDLSGPERRARVEEMLEVVGLASDASRPYREYSSGMRQRLSIARGLLASPNVLLMDEPTRALDPPSAGWIRRFVRERLARERGVTVLLATHDLLEAATTCDRLSLVESGRIVATGTIAELRKPLAGLRRTAITLLPPHDEVRRLAPEGSTTEIDDAGHARLVVPGGDEEIAALVARLAAAGARITAVEPQEADLAALFERLAGSAPRAGDAA